MLELKTRALAAVLESAPKNDERFYLNGVLIERRGASLYMVATDGFTLFVVREDYQPRTGDPLKDDGKVILPREELAAAVKSRAERIFVSLNEFPRFSLTYGATEQHGKLIDGHYPDWRRVIPGKVREECHNPYNAMFLSRLQGAFNILQGVPRSRISNQSAELYEGIPAKETTAHTPALMRHPKFLNALGLVLSFTRDGDAETVMSQVHSMLG